MVREDILAARDIKGILLDDLITSHELELAAGSLKRILGWHSVYNHLLNSHCVGRNVKLCPLRSLDGPRVV